MYHLSYSRVTHGLYKNMKTSESPVNYSESTSNAIFWVITVAIWNVFWLKHFSRAVYAVYVITATCDVCMLVPNRNNSIRHKLYRLCFGKLEVSSTVSTWWCFHVRNPWDVYKFQYRKRIIFNKVLRFNHQILSMNWFDVRFWSSLFL